MNRLAASSALVALSALVTAPAALAAPEPVPVSPDNSDLWGLPHDELADNDVSLSLTSLKEAASGDSATESVKLGEKLRAKFRVDNRSTSELTDVQVTVRRAAAVDSAAAAQAALAGSDFPYWANATKVDSVQPNSSTAAFLDIDTALAASPSLSIEKPGAYPLLFTLTGIQDGDPVHLASERLILSVGDPNTLDLDDATGTGTPAIANNEHGLSLIVPVSTMIDPVPGATGDDPLIVRSEDFTHQISAGGRLYELVKTYREHELRGASCMALDPAVVNFASRMTEATTSTSNAQKLITSQCVCGILGEPTKNQISASKAQGLTMHGSGWICCVRSIASWRCRGQTRTSTLYKAPMTAGCCMKPPIAARSCCSGSLAWTPSR
ncbi:hypothetical protein N579_08550 [Corynebacterium pseudodiphtheriticum 090104]|nr:hypothetical protein N579_08550 [Corynebacterium pseudodiphtheriticum 090104]